MMEAPPVSDSVERVHLGNVGVDSGLLIIADPAYIRAEARSGETADEFYGHIGSEVLPTRLGGPISSTVIPSGFAVACKVSSDGTYPVWGYLRADGYGLQRIVIDLSTD